MFYFPTNGNRTNRAVMFAFDDSCFPFRHNLHCELTKPEVREQPVLTPGGPDDPDSLASHFYGTVLFDEGKYRMWYVGMSLGLNPDMPVEEWKKLEQKPGLQRVMMGPICYAESEDGIRWTKPDLGQLLYKGSRHNNALDLPDAIIHCPTVLKDDEDPDPNRRYKMVYQYYLHTEATKGWPTMRTAVSPDGIRWTAGPRGLIGEFVEHSSFYKFNGYYIVNGQTNDPWRKGEGGAPRGRQGFVYISPDFEHWLEESAESFALPEPHDPELRGLHKEYDQVHLGTAPLTYGNVAVGLYCIWHNREPFTEISGDFALVLSDDGIRFREPVKGHVYLHAEESPVTPVPGKFYNTVLCQANGILNVGEETRIYHGRWRNSWLPHGSLSEDYYGEVALAVLPRDRWGALMVDSGREKGSVWSVPVTLPEGAFELKVNADGTQGIRIELSDERFRLISGFSGENSGFVREGGLDCPVVWPGDLIGCLAGQTVRIRVSMDNSGAADPKLYAVYGVAT